MKQFILSAAICAMTAPALTGCGFTPLHAQNASGLRAPLPAVNLTFVDTKALGATGQKAEFLVRQALSDRMATGTARYNLDLTSRLSRTPIGLRGDDVASRYDMSMSVRYVLTDAATGDVIERDEVSAISTFNSPNDPYGTTAATENATQRVAREVSDRLVLKISKAVRAP